MITKEQVLIALESMPDEFDVDELIESLIVIDKINQGLDDIKHGRVHTEEEVMKKVDEWVKSNDLTNKSLILKK
ncbi:MAG: hypothetical protein V1779_07490 [bacterium]